MTHAAAWKTVAALALAAAGTAHAQSELIIIQPGAGFETTRGIDINDAGEVLVSRRRASASTEPVRQWDAVWQDDVLQPLTYPAPVQSSCPPSGSSPPQVGNWTALVGNAINDAGVVAGSFQEGCSYYFPATWSRSGNVTRFIPDSPACPTSFPYPTGMELPLISDGGHIAAHVVGCFFSGPTDRLWNSSTLSFRSLPVPAGVSTYAISDINALGVAVGSSPGVAPRVLLWNSAGNGVADLGSGQGRAINDQGSILINTNQFSDVVWRDNVVTQLDQISTPPDLRIGIAKAINDIGTIVSDRAIIIGSERYNLSQLGLSRPGFFNWQVTAINNSNWIVGTVVEGVGTNLARAFLFKIVLPCDTVDFNANGVFPEDQDVVDFFDVLAGASCPACNDIDFNNNGVFPEDQDVIDFFNVLAGGTCP